MQVESVDTLLLDAVGAYEASHGTGPTVREVAEDLGVPADFGHDHLVRRLEHELARERLAQYRRRFALTAAGRLALEAEAARRGSPQRSAR